MLRRPALGEAVPGFERCLPGTALIELSEAVSGARLASPCRFRCRTLDALHLCDDGLSAWQERERSNSPATTAG